MENVKNTVRRQSSFLFWEFVVIVLGVLSALAVDQWREEQALEDERRHVLMSLLTDLREDQEDYSHFVKYTRARAVAAVYLDKLANGIAADLPPPYQNAGEALGFIALATRLQTTRSAIEEIASTGGRATITDDELRTRILKYYALATDRSAINQFIEPQLQRSQAALEQIGVSHADGAEIDVATVLADRKVHALVRSIGQTAEFAPLYCRELIEMNEGLIADIEQILSEN
jgi:Arc/MetJ family transcription regulator